MLKTCVLRIAIEYNDPKKNIYSTVGAKVLFCKIAPKRIIFTIALVLYNTAAYRCKIGNL